MRKAFTLIEVLVSVVLLGLISIFVSSTIYQTKVGSKFFESIVEKTDKTQRFEDILYRDIVESKELEIRSSKKYSVVYIRGKNTIYNISNPYVTWLVLKNSDTLVRMESARQIELPVRDDARRYIFLDIVQKNCRAFLLKKSKNQKSILIYIKIKNQKPAIFEVQKI